MPRIVKKKIHNIENKSLYTFGGRLFHWRENIKGFKLKELEEITGIPNNTLSNLENNQYLPSGEIILKLIQKTDIGIYWLLNNEGPMIRPSDEDRELVNRALRDPLLMPIIRATIDDFPAKLALNEVIDVKMDFDRLLNRLKEYIGSKSKTFIPPESKGRPEKIPEPERERESK